MVEVKRKAISAKTRFEIFKRDLFACQYCGSHPPTVILEVDHIVPVAEGGKNNPENLVTACWNCNRGKGARSLTDVPISLRDKAMEVAEREAQLRGYNDVMEGRRQRLDDDVWRVGSVFMERFGEDRMYRANLQSIKHFVEKLGLHECLDAMERATAKVNYQSGCFKYFCGICWAKIREAENGPRP